MTTSMSEAIREPAWLATSRARSQMTMSINKTIEKQQQQQQQQQQQLAKEVFSPQITKLSMMDYIMKC